MALELSSCPACRGLVPASAVDCPHCDAVLVASPLTRAAKRLLVVATGGAVAMTLMACYGMPPCEDGEDENCIDESGAGGGGGGGGTTTGGTTTGGTTTGSTTTASSAGGQ